MRKRGWIRVVGMLYIGQWLAAALPAHGQAPVPDRTDGSSLVPLMERGDLLAKQWIARDGGVAPEGAAARAAPALVVWVALSDTADAGGNAVDGGATRAQEPAFTMRIGARVQTRFTHADPPDAPTTNTFSIRRARLSLTGAAYELFEYALQVELAGGGAQLLDANLRHTFAPYATVWVGQGKAYFGRQLLTSSSNLQFVDRTLVDGRFAAGRQQGGALTGRVAAGRLEYALGAYNGNGINQSVNVNNRFMTVGRVVVMPFDPHPLTEGAHDYPSRPRLALAVAGLRNTVGEGEAEVGIRRMNLESAFMLLGLSATGEFYREWAEPFGAATLNTRGWYAQAGYLLPDRRNELAVRYGTIHPLDHAGTDLSETGIAYSHYLRAHSAKIQADLRNVRDRTLGSDLREARVQLQLTL